MTYVLALLCCAAVQVDDPYESRQPKLRDQLLERGGGSKETEAAVVTALAWLAKAQKADGSWESPEDDYTLGVTGLTLLAFLGAGHSPKSEPYGKSIRSGLQFLLSAQDTEGCIGAGSAKYLYGHAIATAVLAEALAMSGVKDYQVPAQKAVDFLVEAQNPGKGWRYSSKCGDNDTSVTAWAVQALASAERAGLRFPKVVYEAATAWIDEVTQPSGRVVYLPSAHKMIPGPDEMFDKHETPTAMGILSRLLMSKRKNDPRLAAGSRILAKDLPRWEKNAVDYCYWHFGTVALFRLDGPAGETWTAWNAALKTALLKNQAGNGSWDPVDRWCSRHPSRVYATAINALTLETYYRDVRFFHGLDEADRLYRDAREKNGFGEKVTSFADLDDRTLKDRDSWEAAAQAQRLLLEGARLDAAERLAAEIRLARCLSFLAREEPEWEAAKAQYEAILRPRKLIAPNGTPDAKVLEAEPSLLPVYYELGVCHFEIAKRGTKKFEFDLATTVFSNVLRVVPPDSALWWYAKYRVLETLYEREAEVDLREARPGGDSLRVGEKQQYDGGRFGMKPKFEALMEKIRARKR